MKAPKRVLLARINHETHTFVEGVAGIDQFLVLRNAEMLPRSGDGSLIDGIVEVAEAEGWELIPTVNYGGAPSGPTVDHRVFEQFWSEFEPPLDRAMMMVPLDTIYLVLHGAMVTTESVDPQGELLARLRARPGLETIPIFGCFDLHANFSRRMGDLADCFVGYQHNPHTDVRETAVRAAQMLARTLDTGVRPHMRVKHAPVIWSPSSSEHRVGPPVRSGPMNTR